MNIRDSIREEFRKKSPKKRIIKEANKWDSRTQPNLYELENFLRKSGYQLADIIEHEDNIPELLIEPLKTGHLHPEIVHDVSEGLFYAKIVEHGMLVASDIEEIIKGYTTALGVLSHLENLDLKKLEV